jgi:hypothetical protein
MTDFRVKSSIILSVLAKKISLPVIYNIMTFVATTKNGRTKKFFLSSFGAFVRSGMDIHQDPGSGVTSRIHSTGL